MFDDLPSVLITGASGFLGQELVKSLNGYKILMTSRKLNLDTDAGNFIEIDLNKGIKTIPKVDLVVHCAGKAHSVPNSIKEEREFYDVNFEGTKNLCEALVNFNALPKSIIFISTVAVYGVDVGLNINESHPLDGKTPYAQSKILAENFLIVWAQKNNVKLSILRLPLVCGPNPPGNLGTMIKAMKSGRYLSIGKATARKSMVWAADIAEVVPRLACIGGIYNLTDGFHPSFGELETTITNSLKKRLPIRIPLSLANILGRIGDLLSKNFPINSDKLKKITSTLVFDDSKARNELGWNPSSVLEKLRENL